MATQIDIILASQSKRRIAILNECGLTFKTQPANINEINHKSKTPESNALSNATLKACAIANKNRNKNSFIIGADTIVVFNKKLIGKPKSLSQADTFLKEFSKKTLKVHTALHLINSETNQNTSSITTTTIHVKTMDKKTRKAILKKIDPLDRAGGFSIEGIASFIFDSIEGSFYNVLGLPTITLNEMFLKLNINLLDYING